MTQPPSSDTRNQPGADNTRSSRADTSELLHYKTQLDAVERISQALFQSIDLDELVETTLHIALEEVGAEAGSILLADSEKEELIFQYSIGDKPVPRGTAIPWDKGISGAVFQSGEEYKNRDILNPFYRLPIEGISTIVHQSFLRPPSFSQCRTQVSLRDPPLTAVNSDNGC